MVVNQDVYSFLIRNKVINLFILLQYKHTKSIENIARKAGMCISHAQVLIKEFEKAELISISKPNNLIHVKYTQKGEMLRHDLITLTKRLKEE